MGNRIQTYKEFWPYYLSEHSNPRTRKLHVVGTVLSVGIVPVLIFYRLAYCIPLVLIVGYGFAWYSHFFIEKNRPATFQYPVWSFISDFRMAYLYLRRKL